MMLELLIVSQQAGRLSGSGQNKVEISIVVDIRVSGTATDERFGKFISGLLDRGERRTRFRFRDPSSKRVVVTVHKSDSPALY